jgi:hypothetical protein
VQVANHKVAANFVRRMPANDRGGRGSHGNNFNLTKRAVMRANSLTKEFIPPHSETVNADVQYDPDSAAIIAAESGSKRTYCGVERNLAT